MRRIFKYIWYLTAGLVGFVLIYLLTAWVLSRITVAKERGPAGDIAIYIKTNGVHTDLVVPVKNDLHDWSTQVKFSNTHLRDTSSIKYLGIGWGDKGFYLETPTWAALKFSTAFKAAFGQGKTAMHTTFYGPLPESESCRKIMVSPAQYLRLTDFISNGFSKDNNDNVMLVVTTANYNDADAFYEANGRYSMLYTCNTWANSGLQSAGQKACLWTPFDTGIFLKYK